jgi:hypothetical protein
LIWASILTSFHSIRNQKKPNPRHWGRLQDEHFLKIELDLLKTERHHTHQKAAQLDIQLCCFGKDNGVPAGILSIKDYVSDADFERLKQEWRANYGGTKRRTAFLRGASIEWQNIGLSYADLDFLQGRKAHRDELLMLFGIPIGLVSENATEANAKVAERQFIERTLYPKLVRLAQKISQEMLPFYPGSHLAEFEDIRPTDTQARLHEIQAARSILSINEIRQKYYDLPSVAWGEMPETNRPNGDSTSNTANVGTRYSASADEPAPTNNDDIHGSSKSALDELAQWERFALNRIEKPGKRPFHVEIVPDEIAFEISARLCVAGDKDAVKAVFAAARDMVRVEDAPPVSETS